MQSRHWNIVMRSGFAGALLVCAVLLTFSSNARAFGGTHGVAASTWDASASSIVFAYQNGFLVDGGHFRIASYNANFSSTSGKLSSQFGLHYLNLKLEEDSDVAHGISGTIIAHLALPVTARYDNGLPKISFNLYFGAAPSALIGGMTNYITIPFVLGLGLPMSPSRHVSIIPWGELSLSANLDTVIKPYSGGIDDFDPTTVDPTDPQVHLTDKQVEQIVDESVEVESSFSAKMRGGLSLVWHLGDRVDLQINGIVTRIGDDEKKKTAVFVGGGLVIAWDDPVPAVLPAAKRLRNESCDVVTTRFEECPQYGDLVDRVRNEGKDEPEPVAKPPVAAPPAAPEPVAPPPPAEPFPAETEPAPPEPDQPSQPIVY